MKRVQQYCLDKGLKMNEQSNPLSFNLYPLARFLHFSLGSNLFALGFRYLSFSLFFFVTVQLSSQNISINDSGADPDPSAMLDVADTSRGFLPPRMSTIQMNNVLSPANGLMVYNTDSAGYFYFDGVNWLSITSLSPTSSTVDEVEESGIAFIKDVKASNASGGTFTSGSWMTRDLNKLEGDTSFISLSSNEFSLSAGVYKVEWIAPAYKVGVHISRLFDATNAQQISIGSSEYNASSDNIQTSSIGSSILELNSNTTFRIEHRCEITSASNGLGVSTNFGSDAVYTQVKIIKLDKVFGSGVNTTNDSTNWVLADSNLYYNSGNVGIGVDTPSAKLHLHGNGPFGAGARVVFGDDYRNSSNQWNAFIGESGWDTNTDSDQLQIHGRLGTFFTVGSPNSGSQLDTGVSIASFGRLQLYPGKASNTYLRIFGDTGQVGIWATNDTAGWALLSERANGNIFQQGAVGLYNIKSGKVAWVSNLDGKFGIGNNDPQHALQLGSFGENQNQFLSIKTGGGNFWKAGLIFKHFNDDLGFSFYSDEVTNNLFIDRHDSDTNTVLSIDRFTGDVGIGINDAINTLDVRSQGTDDAPLFGIGNSDRSHFVSIFGGRQSDPNPFIMWKDGDPLRFATDNSGYEEKMRITSDGHLGIGTANPNLTLTIGPSDDDTGFETNSDGNLSLFTDGVERVRFDEEGDVGIGINNPSYRLHVVEEFSSGHVMTIENTSTSTNADGLRIVLGRNGVTTANNFISFYEDGGTLIGEIQGGTSTGHGGSLFSGITSDRRLKTNIKNYESGLNLLSEIQPRVYERKLSLGEKEIGFIAQELQLVYPQMVSGDSTVDVKVKPMMVDYNKLTPVMVAGIKELHSIIKAQQLLIDQQNQNNERQQYEIDALKGEIEELKNLMKDEE